MKTNPFLVFSLVLGILAVAFVCTIKLSHHTIKPQVLHTAKLQALHATKSQTLPPPPAPSCYVYMSPDALEKRGDTIPPPGYRTMEEYRQNWEREIPYPAKQVITPKSDAQANSQQQRR